MVEEIRLNDIGTTFKMTVKSGDTAEDISSATTKEYIFSKPDGTTVTKTAQFDSDGTDGILSYTTVDGDTDLVGVWKYHAYVVLTCGEFRTSIVSFRVYPNL